MSDLLSGVIIYGWRRVGKSILVDKFLEMVLGFRINCAWISDPETFGLIVLQKLAGLIGEHEILGKLRLLIYEEKQSYVSS